MSIASENPAIVATQRYQARIYITLRPSVLDPAGTAVQSSLAQLGYQAVSQVRIGKYVELSLDAATDQDAGEQVERMCQQLLANPVIEIYRFEIDRVDSE